MSADVTIKVGDSVYSVVKSGREQAKQVARLTKWLSKYGITAINSVKGKTVDGNDTAQTIEVMLELFGALSEDALLELFGLVTGCTQDEAEKYFDVADLIDAVVIVYEEQPSIRRLVERFFSVPASTKTSEESSTTSEPPTDGQTK